jgi:nitrile hydratase accessory protein
LSAPDPPPFTAPWQAEAFALTVALHARGAFTWSEWASALSARLASTAPLAGGEDYWSAWQSALEDLSLALGLADPDALARRKADWTKAYLATPHGLPVNLASREAGSAP